MSSLFPAGVDAESLEKAHRPGGPLGAWNKPRFTPVIFAKAAWLKTLRDRALGEWVKENSPRVSLYSSALVSLKSRP